jgi:hypothetical protein
MIWIVRGVVTVGAWTLVEADTAEEAAIIAKGREGKLCPYGLGRDDGNPTEEAIIEEGDGSMLDCTAEPASPDDVRAWDDYREDFEGADEQDAQ